MTQTLAWCWRHSVLRGRSELAAKHESVCKPHLYIPQAPTVSSFISIRM